MSLGSRGCVRNKYSVTVTVFITHILKIDLVTFFVMIEVNVPIYSRPRINLEDRSRYQPPAQCLRRLMSNVRASKVTSAIYVPDYGWGNGKGAIV